MNRFKLPKKSLGDVDADTAANLIAAAVDIALVVDKKGVIRDLSFGSDSLAAELDSRWRGQLWLDTVTVESRPKIEALLRDGPGVLGSRWRQVNHLLDGQRADLPVSYRVVPLPNASRVVAVGRDLSEMSSLQHRLMDVSQAIEREFARARFAEGRFNLLFQMASEAVLVLEAGTQRITEANPAATALLGAGARRASHRVFPEGFEAAGTQAIQAMLTMVTAAGRADAVQARRVEGGQEWRVSASLFRNGSGAYFLVQLAPLHANQSPVVRQSRSKVVELIESSPDGFVVTDLEGRVLFANRAFLDVAQLSTEEQARGKTLERWIGRPGADLAILLSNLRQHQSVRLFATVLRGEFGSDAEVEVSAVAVPEGEQPCLGFSIRSVDRRDLAPRRPVGEFPRSVAQLTEMVGKVALKDMVRETTDVIERNCIEAALQLTGDNRASTAEVLGLSRQSLYVKLRRLGIGESEGEEE